MAAIYDDASELEKLIHNCEFENQQYVKLIEKEKQLIEALEREVEEKKGETKRLQDAITQLDNDTKHYHKQFTINRDNCENLKKTSQVLTEHLAAMNNKLDLTIAKRKQESGENERVQDHYRNIWEGYKTKYENFPKVQRLRAQQAREEDKRVKTQQAKEKLDDLRRQIEQLQRKKMGGYGDMKTFIIKLAEVYVNTQHTIDEIERKKREIEGKKREKEERQAEANRTEAINQLKEIHLEDKPAHHDQMESETNQKQTPETEEMSSPMISVFSGRADNEEEMQTAEIQAVSNEQTGNLEEPTVQENEPQKPQTWLQNYQEQNQKQLQSKQEHLCQEPLLTQNHVQQKPADQQSFPQPPFVTFHNSGQDQDSSDMEASVSIHLPSRPAGKSSPSKPQVENHLHSQGVSAPSSVLSRCTSQSMSQQNYCAFTNPAFQTTPTVHKFTLPSVSLKVSASKPATISQKLASVPLVISNKVSKHSDIAPSHRSLLIPSIQSPQIPSSIQTQKRVPMPSVQLPSNMSVSNQKPTTLSQKPAQMMEIPATRLQMSNFAHPVQQPISRSSPNLRQIPQQSIPQLQYRPSVFQSRPHTPASQPSSSFQIPQVPSSIQQTLAAQLAVPATQPLQSHCVQAPQRTQNVTGSHSGHLVSQRQKTSPPQALITSSPMLEAQKGSNTVQIQQAGLEHETYRTGQLFPSKPKTPEASPKIIPMQVSPMMNAENETQAELHTPEHPEAKVQSSEGQTSSPFNLEKHKEKLKSINRSPGHPLFLQDRRMFDSGKGESSSKDSAGQFGSMSDNSPSFMMFGGGDGFGFSPFGEKKLDSSTGFLNSEGGFSLSNEGPASPADGNLAALFGSGGKSDQENSKSPAFSFNFGSFSTDPKSPGASESPDGTDFAALFGGKSDNQMTETSSFTFNFGSFDGDPKSPSSGVGSSDDGTNFATLFGGSGGTDTNNNNDFSFNFGSSGSDAKSKSAEKFSFF